MDCSLPGSFVLGDLPGNNTGVGCYFRLQGIFLTQGWNPLLWYRQAASLLLSHQGDIEGRIIFVAGAVLCVAHCFGVYFACPQQMPLELLELWQPVIQRNIARCPLAEPNHPWLRMAVVGYFHLLSWPTMSCRLPIHISLWPALAKLPLQPVGWPGGPPAHGSCTFSSNSSASLF